MQKLLGKTNIIQLLDVFFNPKDETICIVTEYYPKNLDQIVRSKPKTCESDDEEESKDAGGFDDGQALKYML